MGTYSIYSLKLFRCWTWVSVCCRVGLGSLQLSMMETSVLLLNLSYRTTMTEARWLAWSLALPLVWIIQNTRGLKWARYFPSWTMNFEIMIFSRSCLVMSTSRVSWAYTEVSPLCGKQGRPSSRRRYASSLSKWRDRAGTGRSLQLLRPIRQGGPNGLREFSIGEPGTRWMLV